MTQSLMAVPFIFWDGAWEKPWCNTKRWGSAGSVTGGMRSHPSSFKAPLLIIYNFKFIFQILRLSCCCFFK